MSSLPSFGAVMTFAIQTETRLQAYYQAMGNEDRAQEADKRRVKLERIRREYVVEITLEPIDDLDEVALNWDDQSQATQEHNIQLLGEFYQRASQKMNVVQAKRALERLASDLLETSE
jgi:hypothetical protein